MINGYIDVHSHILPGVDDGSKNMEMTMQMIEMAYEQGVRCMIATPHYYPGHKNCSKDTIEKAYIETVKAIEGKYRDFKLYLGNEIYYKDGIIKELKEKEIFSLAGTRYILLEFSVMAEFRYVYDAVKKCVNAGFYPILAHVERYGCLYKEQERVAELINAGAYIQVNAENFKNGLRVPRRKYCRQLMENGMVHFLGSDSHNTDERKPDFGTAISYLDKKVEKTVLERILNRNPQMLLENKCI